jgi:hypothetical protein
MKKISIMLLCSIAMLTACNKNKTLSLADQTPGQAEEVLATEAKSTTVTTEAALKSAVSSAAPGDVITISGTINLTSTLQLLNSGTSSAKINISGGTLNCSGLPAGSWGVKVNGSWWNIQNMILRNGPESGLVLQSGGNNFVNNVTVTGFHDTGIQVYNGATNDNVVNCNSSENYDVANGGENADGFACKLSGGSGNKFDHCTATHNSDDGWDLFGQPATVRITNCVATRNGFGTNGDGNGFKLGSAGQNVPHTVTNCSATNNLAWGYDGNGNTGHITITGSGGSGNGKGLFTRIF